MPEVVQLRAVTLQFAGQLRRRDPLGDPPQDQDQLAGPSLRTVQGRLGEGVEDSLAMATAIIEHRRTVATMSLQARLRMTTWAGDPVGMEPRNELEVAGILIQKIRDREVHDHLRRARQDATQLSMLLRDEIVNDLAPSALHEPTTEPDFFVMVPTFLGSS